MLKAVEISKHFGGVHALQNVNLELVPGEIHGLVGENGAGKSTLMKILAGVYQPDSGSLFVDGKPVRFKDPKHAYDSGVRIVYQELSLIPSLTVAENLYLHRFSRGGLKSVKRSALVQETFEALKTWGLDISPVAPVENLTMGKRQLVEIVREISKKGRVLILDEPTSSLTNTEVERIFEVLGMLKEQGVAIGFISHRLNEVMQIADRITILRNGRSVASRPAAGLTSEEIASLIVGREIRDLYPKASVAIGREMLSVENLTGKGFRNVSFTLHEGEILGMAGLIGAGRSEILRSLFGLNSISKGKIMLNNEAVLPKSPSEAIDYGIALLSESRTDEGIFPLLSVGKNIIIMKLREVARHGWLMRELVQRKVDNVVHQLGIVTYNAFRQEIGFLSGGNQQKALLGRLLGAQPRILLLDEPTRGVDVGTKAEIHRIMGDFVSDRNAIIMVSSDVPELMGMCDRIIVLHQGKMVGEFPRDQFRQEDIMRCQCGLALPQQDLRK